MVNSSFSMRIVAAWNSEDYDPPQLEFEVESVEGGYDIVSDHVESVLLNMPDSVHDALSDVIDEPGTYDVNGDIWVTSMLDDGDDCEVSNLQIRKLNFVTA
jgi:hypothetical protein